MITIHFDGNFETESCSSSCTCDYVVVYDGATTSDTEIGTYCGTTAPGYITSSSNNLLVTFISNVDFQSNGFSATFYFEGKHIVVSP